MPGRNEWCLSTVALLAAATGLHFLLATSVGAQTIRIGGTGAALTTMRVLSESYKSRSSNNVQFVIVPGLGSGGGRRALSQGAIDIAVTSKAGNDIEKGDGANTVLLGKTPFVFATSTRNPISGLTSHDVLNIFNGTMLQWPDGRRLRLILQPEQDSDTELLKRISPVMEQAVKNALGREGMKITVTDGETADALETIQGAFGSTTLALIVSEKRSLKALALDGAAPSPKSIADKSYPYFKSIYALAATKATRPAEEFLAFLRSRSAREVLADLGYWVGEGPL